MKWIVRLLVICSLLGPQLLAAARMQVHEWGTFTCLQDDDGREIGGINTDDEPVPEFVHDLKRSLLIEPDAAPPVLTQGAPSCHPDVTMRLETPVIYFHPADGAAATSADVEVAFNGGWLTQYYPDAIVDAPGIGEGENAFGHIAPSTRGTLKWKGLKIGTDGKGPDTPANVWIAPRKVKAAGLTTAAGESERFLFYRGVGNVSAPLRVLRGESGTLALKSRLPQAEETQSLRVSQLWLVDIRADGSTALRDLGPVELTRDCARTIANVSAAFAPAGYAAKNLGKLRDSMRARLIAEGLFEDEADALLNTWELSYFKSPGRRLFFIVPRAWTEQTLPLKLSVPADVSRVMVGRIELITPEQRNLLRQISTGPASESKWLIENMLPPHPGTTRPTTAPEPDDYRAYVQLGRFRNALVLDEQAQRPSEPLKTFINNYKLGAYRIPER